MSVAPLWCKTVRWACCSNTTALLCMQFSSFACCLIVRKALYGGVAKPAQYDVVLVPVRAEIKLLESYSHYLAHM